MLDSNVIYWYHFGQQNEAWKEIWKRKFKWKARRATCFGLRRGLLRPKIPSALCNDDDEACPFVSCPASPASPPDSVAAILSAVLSFGPTTLWLLFAATGLTSLFNTTTDNDPRLVACCSSYRAQWVFLFILEAITENTPDLFCFFSCFPVSSVQLLVHFQLYIDHRPSSVLSYTVA